ncbi:MAG: hypothetical protein PHQ23_05695 [Candidatus Wallbacteria bacterium]|nr:hypothetical protein [Candidatus Wallbacteria bacterium]
MKTDLWWNLVLSFFHSNLKYMLVLSFGLMGYFVCVKWFKLQRLAAGKKHDPGPVLIFISASIAAAWLMIVCLRPMASYIYFYYGFQSLSSGRHDLAYEEFLTAYNMAPSNNAILDRLAFASYAVRPPAEALPWFQALENRRSLSPEMGIYYGHLLLESGETDKAGRILAYARDNASKPGFAFFYLGILHQLQGQYAEAEKELCQALELEGKFGALIRWQMVELFRQSGNTEKVLSALDEIGRLYGVDPAVERRVLELRNEYKKNGQDFIRSSP